MTQEEEIAHLRAENQALREALNQALAQFSQVQEDLRVALVRIEELEKRKKRSRGRNVRRSTTMVVPAARRRRSWSIGL